MSTKELKKVLLEALIRRIQEGELVWPKGADEPVTLDAPASTLTAAVSFLKAFPPMEDDEQAEELSNMLSQYKDKMKVHTGPLKATKDKPLLN